MVKYIPKADTHDKDYSGYQMCKHQPQRIKKKTDLQLHTGQTSPYWMSNVSFTLCCFCLMCQTQTITPLQCLWPLKCLLSSRGGNLRWLYRRLPSDGPSIQKKMFCMCFCDICLHGCIRTFECNVVAHHHSVRSVTKCWIRLTSWRGTFFASNLCIKNH